MTDGVGDGGLDGCRVYPQWRKLFSAAFDEIERRKFCGEWYIVCGTAFLMLAWGEHYSSAVKRGAKLRLAHHASNSPDVCPSVAAEWKMNIEHLSEPDPIGFLKLV